MSNTFNLTRFVSYFKKHTVDNGKTYLLSTAVLIGILIIALFFVVAMGNGHLSIDWQMTVLTSCVLIGGTIFTSLIFSELGDKKKAIPALTLPVSSLEKYLVAWIYTYIIFLIISVGTFYLVDRVAVSVSIPSKYYGPNKLLDLNSKETHGSFLLAIFTVLHAIAFWGAVYFDKLHFIKTAFVFFVGLICINVFNKVLLSIITGGRMGQQFLLNGAHVNDDVNNYYIQDNPAAKVGVFITIAIVVLLWASAFFKLKEKQV